MNERQSSPRGRRIGRRTFLGTVPAAVAAGIAAPALAGQVSTPPAAPAPAAAQQADTPLHFGVETLKSAENVIGVRFKESEEEMLLRGANRNLESYQALRTLEIPLDTALYALEVARRAGVRTILNPAPAPAHTIAPDVDYLTPNETEAEAVSGARGTLVLTLGEQGAQVGDERVPAFPAVVVDTTGAGDAFTSAFAVALAEGLSDRDAVCWGCAAGAHMVEHPGVVPGLPTRAQLEARLTAVSA